MPREQHAGECDACGQMFRWYTIHNGFNNSFYAYCSGCGTTAILDFYGTPLTQHPAVAKLIAGEIPKQVEDLLKPCTCGSRFLPGARPRCPNCAHELLPRAGANDYASAGSQRKARGWPLTWNPAQIYCVIINDRVVYNPFNHTGTE